MLTLMFMVFAIIIFGKLGLFAFRAAWGLTRIILTFVFLPFILIGCLLVGLLPIAILVLAIAGIGALLCGPILA